MSGGEKEPVPQPFGWIAVAVQDGGLRLMLEDIGAASKQRSEVEKYVEENSAVVFEILPIYRQDDGTE